MTALNTSSVCHLLVRWSGTLSQCIFFPLGILFFSARPRRFGEKKVTRNIEEKAHGLKWVQQTSQVKEKKKAQAEP